ncbi:MAG: hypothetical protein H7A25_18565 [Leptospiraceae bacterium]|nr:hypothetical protein [Leptospiraceae bacterium]
MSKKPLHSFKETVGKIVELSDKYWTDLLLPNKLKINFKELSPQELFNTIQSIPYEKDPEGIEHVSRPKILLEFAGQGIPFDCDDRTVIVLSYFKLKNHQLSGDTKKPFQTKIRVTGRNDRPHHVFASYRIPNITDWIALDPTYPRNVYGLELFKPGYEYERLV